MGRVQTPCRSPHLRKQQSPDLITLRFDVLVYGKLPSYCLNSTCQNNHSLCPAFEKRRYVLAEVLNYDVDFLIDVVRMKPYPPHYALHSSIAFNLFVVQLPSSIRQPEGELIGRVVPQHIEYETL